jgi:alpha-beta hydrolase superfamily lysophospholipase
MSLINDYTYRVLTDQNERDIARLAEHNRQVRLALSGRVSWWRRLQAARRAQRIHTATEHPVPVAR